MMKILLPNAKELNTTEQSQPWQPLNLESQEVLASLLDLSLSDLASYYKLKEDRATLEYDRFQRIKNQQAKTYPALLLYDGLMYRYMKRRDLSQQERQYWQDHVRIATGLYGLIQPFDLISPHRLDFQGKLTVAGKSLKQYWRKAYDQELAGEETILSLLSSEFEQVFSPKVQAKMVRLVFMEQQAGTYKVHSTISKKGRGRLVSLLAEENIQDIETIKQLTFDGFSYLPDQSTVQKLVFVRDGNEN